MKQRLYSAICRWELTKIETIDEKKERAIYAAVSKEHGPVILKVADRIQIRKEYEALNAYEGNGCCRAFAYNENLGALLEERIIPGIVLRKENALQKRISAFAAVFHRIHRAGLKKPGTESYLDWLESINRFCVANSMDKELCAKAKLAGEICAEMFRKYPERVLLHGDLHHDNMLLQEDGAYTAIDPKGVIGPELFDLARYMINEVDTNHSVSDQEHMSKVVWMVSRVFDYPIEDVKKVYFMEVILANVWRIEDHKEINRKEIELSEELFAQKDA